MVSKVIQDLEELVAKYETTKTEVERVVEENFGTLGNSTYANKLVDELHTLEDELYTVYVALYTGSGAEIEWDNTYNPNPS